MAQFIVVPAVVEDMRDLAEIFVDAFSCNQEFAIMNRNVNREELIDGCAKDYEKTLEKPGRKFFKVIEVETGKIVGMSLWWFPHTLTPEQIEAGIGKEQVPESFPPGTEVALLKEFLGKIYETRAKNLNSENAYFVNILGVRPEFQRKGLGALLLQHGLELADRDGARTYIEASAKGFGLYKKLGWVEIDTLFVDTAPYGGDGPELTRLMWREPHPLKN